MAEVKNYDEEQQQPIPTKRNPDLTPAEEESNPLKKQKPLEEQHLNGVAQQAAAPQETEEDKQEEEEVEEEVRPSGKDVIDRKGKGILIEEDEDDEDDDDDDDDDDDESDDEMGIGGELSSDGEFVDDPLAEVDLDNILPSRTRRRQFPPGSYIANDVPGDDDDESDDPDA